MSWLRWTTRSDKSPAHTNTYESNPKYMDLSALNHTHIVFSPRFSYMFGDIPLWNCFLFQERIYVQAQTLNLALHPEHQEH